MYRLRGLDSTDAYVFSNFDNEKKPRNMFIRLEGFEKKLDDRKNDQLGISSSVHGLLAKFLKIGQSFPNITKNCSL